MGTCTYITATLRKGTSKDPLYARLHIQLLRKLRNCGHIKLSARYTHSYMTNFEHSDMFSC